MRALILLFLLLTKGTMAQISTQDSGTFKYRQILSLMHLDQVVKEDKVRFSKLQFKLRMIPRNARISPGELAITLSDSSPPAIYHANRFGAFDIPMSKNMYETDPNLLINKGFSEGLSVGIELKILVDSGIYITTETVRSAEKEYKNAVSHMSFIERLLAPKLRTLILRTTMKTMRCILDTNGVEKKLPLPDQLGELRIKLSDLGEADSQKINCNSPVDEYLLES